MRILALLAFAILLAAADAPKTGTYQVTFSERHPESAYEKMRVRYAWPPSPGKDDVYDIAQEKFEVLVPKEYTGDVPYGLLVYTNAGAGGCAGMYSGLMAKYKLIWIGASNVPNERSVVARWGLSLDAVWNMCKRYKIDPRRIYASGISGGGRCASMVAPTYADVFSGAICLVGVNNPVWPPEKLIGKPIRELALANRYALMTGDDDMNLQDTKDKFANMKSQGFKHVEFFQEPKLGHTAPSDAWFEKALVFVDQPLVDEATALLAQGKALAAKKPYDACVAYRKILSSYPIALAAQADAKAGFTALADAVDTTLRGEMAKLGSASADKLRAFAVRCAGFPCEKEARDLADTAGAKELDAILAQPGAMTPSKLEKFLGIWTDYACAQKALAAYDDYAAKALAPIEAQPAGKRTRALAKYLKDWVDCPSRTKAEGLLDGELSIEVDALVALDPSPNRNAKLLAFAKAWPGTKAAAKAEEALIAASKAATGK